VIVGLFGGEFRMPLPMFALKSLRIVGSYVGSPADLRELVTLAQRVTLPEIPLELRPLTEVNPGAAGAWRPAASSGASSCSPDRTAA
jgi:D-arabinose 1-dehydrogenase-like Zn-dependent alcohol dehydrogenase